jgi:hypothetical protein
MATTEHQDADYWYKPGPTVSEFHASKATIRVLIGGRGSGKTTAIAVEAVLKHAWLYAGSRIYVLRKTETSNQDTTVETFEQLFQQSGTAYVETESSLFRKKEGGRLFRLPSRKAVELYNQFIQTRPSKSALERWLNVQGDKWCSFLQFSGVPTSSHRASRFRGFECSLLILVEADQFERPDVDMAVACLRWKSPDPSVCDSKGFIREQGIILDTNPPGKRHWIATIRQCTSEWLRANTRMPLKVNQFYINSVRTMFTKTYPFQKARF